MSFIGDMFSSSKGAGFQASAPDPAQIGTAYNQTQQGLFHQEQFVNALNAQNGLANQQSVFGQQQGLANQLQGVSNGTGPNPALAQLNQATGQNVANQSALMAGQRGTGANAGLMARLAAQQGGNLQQQAVGQGATMQAQQQLAAMQQLQSQQANMGNLANSQVAQHQTGLNAYNTAALQQQQNLLGLQANANSANAAIAGGNQGAQRGLLGGLMNGAGSVMGMFGGGGGGNGLNADGSISTMGSGMDNGTGAIGGTFTDTGSAGMGGFATEVAAGGGMAGGRTMQRLADGGAVAGNPLMDPVQRTTVVDREAPQSKVGQMLSGNPIAANTPQGVPAVKKGGGGGPDLGQAGGLAMKGLMKWGEHEALPYLKDFFGGAAGAAGTLATVEGPQMAGGALDATAATAPSAGAALATDAPVLMAGAHGGGVNGEMLAAQGKQVPGHANVQGDSYKNDTVPARLSPGEIVIPRHIALGPNAPQEAAKFVANVLAKEGNFACGGRVNNYAEGGGVRKEIPVQMPDPEMARAAYKGFEEGQTLSKGWQNLKEEFGYGENKPQQKVKGYAEGTPNAPVGMEQPDQRTQFERDFPNANTLVRKWFNPPNYTPGQDAGMGPKPTYDNRDIAKINMEPQPVEGKAPHSNYDLGSPQDTQQAHPQQDMYKGYDPTAGSRSMLQGAEMEYGKPGDAEPGGIQGQMAQQTMMAEQAKAKILNDVNETMQAQAQEHDDEIRSTLRDMKQGKIDPRAYINNMGGGQKVSTAIGLILGGMGGGLTGQENPALKFLMSNIDKDVEAQKANMGQKNNILAAYEKLYGDKQVATQMTKALLLAKTDAELQEAMAKNGGELAQARGLQIRGPILNAYHQALYDASMRKVMLQGMQSGNPEGALPVIRMVNPAMAKEMESRMVPGIGFASIPVPDKARDEMRLRHDFDQKVTKLEAFAQKHQGTVLDRAIVQYGKTLAQDANNASRAAANGGVWKAGEQEMLSTLIDPDPTKFFASMRTLPKYKAMRETNRSDLKNLFKSYGLNPSMPQFNPGK